MARKAYSLQPLFRGVITTLLYSLFFLIYLFIFFLVVYLVLGFSHSGWDFLILSLLFFLWNWLDVDKKGSLPILRFSLCHKKTHTISAFSDFTYHIYLTPNKLLGRKPVKNHSFKSFVLIFGFPILSYQRIKTMSYWQLLN